MMISPGKAITVANAPTTNIGNFASEIQLTPQEYLKRRAGADFGILNQIVICESGWHPEAKNSHSSASGLFQFLDSTWGNWGQGDVFNPYDNIDAGIRLYRADGLGPWLASKTCWLGAVNNPH